MKKFEYRFFNTIDPIVALTEIGKNGREAFHMETAIAPNSATPDPWTRIYAKRELPAEKL